MIITPARIAEAMSIAVPHASGSWLVELVPITTHASRSPWYACQNTWANPFHIRSRVRNKQARDIYMRDLALGIAAMLGHGDKSVIALANGKYALRDAERLLRCMCDIDGL